MRHSSEQTSASSTHGAPCSKTKYHRTTSTSSTSSQSYSRIVNQNASASEADVKFPRIDECAHFHYDTVECGKVLTKLLDGPPDGNRANGGFDFGIPEHAFWIKVTCKGREWVIRRVAKQFKTLDGLLHECVYDRKFTQLSSLRKIEKNEDVEAVHQKLLKYMSRLSELPEDQMSCAPVLHWFEMDNKGRNLVAALRETADINIPAVAAAHAVRRYTAQTADELTLEVGDMVSIIDLTDSNWWRGKCKLRVGSFPSQCVRRINDAKQADEAVPVNLPSSPTSASPPTGFNLYRTKPILKKHGKFMEFLRSFLVTRPTKSRLRQSGILKERVFGCDLGEYLHNSGDEVPIVVTDCTAFVERYGIVDGIYRISGVSSHVQNLRHEYDCERRPSLNRDPSGRGENSFCDPHSVAGLCKLFFRELPNPLLTYQLYNRFAEAINAPEDDRLLKIHDVIQQLPPPHYRTLKHLALHLQLMSLNDGKTSMHCRNLAIVWAPNLLRSRDLEAGLAAFTEARVQSVVTEFLISNADVLFSEKLQNMQYDASRGQKPPRPKSLMVPSAPKLISLEEAQARSRAAGNAAIPVSSNFPNHDLEIENQNQPYRRNSPTTSPKNLPRTAGNSATPTSPIAIVPLATDSSNPVIGKRRQSMDPKFTRPQNSYHPRQYPSQHSTGWRSKIGSFLKKGGNENLHKPNAKVVLRRSQSDDSLLSPHNSRQDINKVGTPTETREEKYKKGEPQSSVRPAMRQVHSPRRSPRPKGRVFMAFGEEENFPPIDDATLSPPAKQRNLFPMDSQYVMDRSFSPGSPDSMPGLSMEALGGSISPSHNMDSTLPVIMGESGLGFDPLKFGPVPESDKIRSFENVILANETKPEAATTSLTPPVKKRVDVKPDVDRVTERENAGTRKATPATGRKNAEATVRPSTESRRTPSAERKLGGSPKSPLNSRRKNVAEIGGSSSEDLDQSSPRAKERNRVERRFSSKRYINITNLPYREGSSSQKLNGYQTTLPTSVANPNYEDIINANVELVIRKEGSIPDQQQSPNKPSPGIAELVKANSERSLLVQANNSNNADQLKENNPDLAKTDPPSPKADDSPEVVRRRRSRNRDHRKLAEKEKTPEKINHKKSEDFHHNEKSGVHHPHAPTNSKSRSRPVDLGDSYSVHYIHNSHRSNGRMRQSITAAFVKDRSRDPGTRLPHSIVRSMDVPPTAPTPLHKLFPPGHYPQSSSSPITKRQRALMAVASMRQRGSVAESSRLHYRSLSAGDELDYKNVKNKQLQGALSRNSSNASFQKVPPRRRHRARPTGERDVQRHAGSHDDISSQPRTCSAPSTPIEGSPVQSHSLIRNSSRRASTQTTGDNYTRHRYHRENMRSGGNKHFEEDPDRSYHSRHRPLTKARSTSGIISPTDNVCASTGLSWV